MGRLVKAAKCVISVKMSLEREEFFVDSTLLFSMCQHTVLLVGPVLYVYFIYSHICSYVSYLDRILCLDTCIL
jgi:hypothetical protein